jgi:hypothetical protein
MRSIIRRTVMAAALFYPLIAHAADLPDPWVQFDTGGNLSVRAVVPLGGECPKMMADGQALARVVRAEPDDAYPSHVCSGAAPAGTRSLTVAGLPVPSLPPVINRIVVVGDSGDANDEVPQAPRPGAELDGMQLARGMALREYGYLVMDRQPSGRTGTMHALDDSVRVRCRFEGRSIDCRTAGQ